MEPLIHILCLEDDDRDAELIQETIDAAGLVCQISRVQTGEEFAEALRRGGYDVILADYRLPNYDGMSALRLVQKLGLEVPFIFVSGTMGEDAAIEGLKEGATDYVLKHKLSRLAPAIERALRDAKNRRERQRAEEELRESMRRNQLILDSLPGAALLIRADLTIVASNKAADLTGAAPGRHCYDALWELVAPCYWCEAQEALQTRKPLQAEIEATGKVWEAHWIPINSDLFFHFVYDITERKEAEQERAKLREQLFQAQKMESIGRLAGGVAHDFNNMLGVIIGQAEMAMMQVSATEPLRHHLQAIHNAAQRSADLTRQLLAFARQQTVRPQVLDLNDIVPGMLKLLRRLIGEDIDLAYVPGHDLWKVRIDPSQIDQILANLVVNARDAIAGVGKLAIETSNVVLDDAYCTDHAEFIPGEYVLLAVSDDGCGINKEILDQIFEPFFTTKGVGEGTGLGLATVYGIVKQNDGFINVYSDLGHGTTFKIYLPRCQAEAAQDQAEAAAKQLQGGSETVLLVEDEKAILDIGRAILEQLGYTVLAAGTPGEAIRLAGEHTGDIQLLISDVVMPEMNGLELAEQLNAMKPGLKCLYMSGYTTNVIAHRGVLNEGVHFIQKPFSLKELAAKVREALEA